MNAVNRKKIKSALEIEQSRPREWELLFLAQLLDDEINFVKSALKQYKTPLVSTFSLEIIKIETINDLANTFTRRSEDINNIVIFLRIFDELSTNGNADTFGEPGKDGNPILIRNLAKRAANTYYEIALFGRQAEGYLSAYGEFFVRNIDPKNDSVSVICKALVSLSTFAFENSKYLMAKISGYSDLIRSTVSGGGNNNHYSQIELIGVSEGIDAVQSATKCINSLLGERSSLQDTSTVSQQSNRPGTIKDVTEWLVNQQKVSIIDLRNLLFPLDHFPGAYIDSINERALDILGEIALTEVAGQITVNSELLRHVIDAGN